MIAIQDDLAADLRRHLGLNGTPQDAHASAEIVVAALGDRLPLAILALVIEADDAGRPIVLRADGGLDLGPSVNRLRLAA